MTLSSIFNSRRFTIFAALTAAAGVYGQGVTPDATTPSARFQSSLLTGSADTISVSRVPVTNSAGTVTYYDLTLTFDVSSTGVLTLSGSPTVTKSPSLITAGFKAGAYVGPSNILSGEALVTVSGPGVAPGGATEWSLAASPGASGCTYPGTATWYVGSIANSPIEARIKKAGITSTAWSYGVGGTGCYGQWEADSLLGFSQISNTLQVVSFTNNGTDQSQPAATITYTLKQ